VNEDELLRLSFIQVYRLFEAYRLKDEERLRKFRLVAYEIWRKGAKYDPGIDMYMPIGKIESTEMTKEELDRIWSKYGKLKRN